MQAPHSNIMIPSTITKERFVHVFQHKGTFGFYALQLRIYCQSKD